MGAHSRGFAAENAKTPVVETDAFVCQFASDKGNNSDGAQRFQPLSPIEVYCVGDAADVRALRARIHRCNGAAMSRAERTKNNLAGQLFLLAAETAGSWTFRRASASELNDIVMALTGLFHAANIYERLETPDGK